MAVQRETILFITFAVIMYVAFILSTLFRCLLGFLSYGCQERMQDVGDRDVFFMYDQETIATTLATSQIMYDMNTVVDAHIRQDGRIISI